MTTTIARNRLICRLRTRFPLSNVASNTSVPGAALAGAFDGAAVAVAAAGDPPFVKAGVGDGTEVGREGREAAVRSAALAMSAVLILIAPRSSTLDGVPDRALSAARKLMARSSQDNERDLENCFKAPKSEWLQRVCMASRLLHLFPPAR